MTTNPKFSVVVSTLGRTHELIEMLESLERQTDTDLEVIIVDQNDDTRLTDALAGRSHSVPVKHIPTPGRRGLSRGRNTGWRAATGRYVVFADDDCWYPPQLFAEVEKRFLGQDADIVSGRAADETGRSINGRYEEQAQWIDRTNVWTTSIEWMVFFKRTALVKLDGFDEDIGVGASTPWQAAEGQDILLRALAVGLTCYFDPALYGHHPEIGSSNPDEAMRKKARAYGRGMGFVLRRHGFSPLSLFRWIGRPAGAALIYTARWQPNRALYYVNVARGRLEGFLRYCP